MRLIQYLDATDQPRVAIVRSASAVEPLTRAGSMHALALSAISAKTSLSALAGSLASGTMLDYQALVDGARLLPPLTHADPAHLLVSGTGLTHLGSADARAAMHSKLQGKDAELTDSMRMFKLGIEGGKPAQGAAGVQPEWFYKGDGAAVVSPGAALSSPDFALDLGDEAEIVGVYLIGDDRRAYRLGFALGNEYSDHKMERINYLYLAHSKLRQCAFGPELLLGELPRAVRGVSRILRQGAVLWQKDFLSGEDNMSHSIRNLEFHHFKYAAFLRPGDVHIHYFGTGTLSFGDRVETQSGDIFELECELFGRKLRNAWQIDRSPTDCSQPVVPL